MERGTELRRLRAVIHTASACRILSSRCYYEVTATFVCRFAKVAGVGIASLGLALSANAATVKLGADGGALVFDPANLNISAGETVEWINNVGFPHNVVFDEDEIPVGAFLVSGCTPACRWKTATRKSKSGT